MGASPQADLPGNFYVQKLGSYAAVASGGAGSLQLDSAFVAPAAIKILSAWRFVNAAEATVGTATSSASYRRMNLVNLGTAADGAALSGTTIMASLNATVSAAASSTRAFATTANNTAPAGAVIAASHLTVGAATADGTDMAAGFIEVAYQLL